MIVIKASVYVYWHWASILLLCWSLIAIYSRQQWGTSDGDLIIYIVGGAASAVQCRPAGTRH